MHVFVFFTATQRKYAHHPIRQIEGVLLSLSVSILDCLLLQAAMKISDHIMRGEKELLNSLVAEEVRMCIS